MIEELRTAKDGRQYFRASSWFKEDAHFVNFGEQLNQLVSGALPKKALRVALEKSVPDLITWLWSDYALLENHYFACQHPYDRYEELFYLAAFEDSLQEETNEYLKASVGIPMWVELSIDYVDTGEFFHDGSLQNYWESRSFTSPGKADFLTAEGSALALMYALENSSDGDLKVNLKIDDVHQAIIQSDPTWYHNQHTYYNWLDFDVTVDKKELEREQKLIGASYGTLSDEQRANLVLAAIDAMGIDELEENKVPQYLMSLLLNHPKTSDESKAQIALIADDHIIRLKD